MQKFREIFLSSHHLIFIWTRKYLILVLFKCVCKFALQKHFMVKSCMCVMRACCCLYAYSKCTKIFTCLILVGFQFHTDQITKNGYFMGDSYNRSVKPTEIWKNSIHLYFLLLKCESGWSCQRIVKAHIAELHWHSSFYRRGGGREGDD